jgi:NADH-quinone oxidoreductase subunit C
MSASGPDQALIKPQPRTPAAAATPAQAPRVHPALPGPDLLTRSIIPFQVTDYALKGYHLDAVVPAEQVVSTAADLDREGFALDTITGVDWLAEGKMEVVYDFFHPTTGLRVVVRSRIPRENCEIPSISKVFPGANWHERETHDFFGINFLGHPNLAPFLLPEDATYHPLRKDFTS